MPISRLPGDQKSATQGEVARLAFHAVEYCEAISKLCC